MGLTKATYSMIQGAVANVHDFGAVGDGVTDDTAAIKAAVATGLSVFFPTGTYLISETVDLESHTVVDLNKSVITGAQVRISGKTDVLVKNGTFTGTGYGYVLNVTAGSSYITLENLTATEVGNGFSFSGAGGAISYIKTTNLSVSQCKGSPYYHGIAQHIMHTNISTYNAAWGLNIVSGCDDIKVVNGYFELGASSTTPTGNDSWYDTTPEHGVYAHQSNNALFVNCTFKGWNRTSGSCGIKWRNFNNIKIIGGVVDGCTLKAGLFIQTDSIQNYLRNCVIDSVVFKNNTSTVFINDYVGVGAGAEEMDVTITNCTFEDNNTTGQIQAGSADSTGQITISNCKSHMAMYISGAWYGSRTISDCVFVTSQSYCLGFTGTYLGVSTAVKNCTFVDWNLSGLVPSTNDEQTLVAALKFDNGSQKISIDSCTFMQDSKRRVGAYGSVSGQLERIVMTNCVGGGDMWASQSGGSLTCYYAGNTSYSSTINSSTTFKSAGNNIKLNNDGTVTVY